MKKIILLFLLALPAVAQTPAPTPAPPQSAVLSPVREAFPSDYIASPCATDAEAVCKTFDIGKMASYGKTFRGFSIDKEWIHKHYEELRKAFLPLCAKMGNCFTQKDNDWVYCLDLMRDDFPRVCDRFPAGSEDYEQCRMFAITYYIGLGAKTKLHREAQECAAAQPADHERTLESWITPETFGPTYDGSILVHAYDSETRIPVRARLTIDGGKLFPIDTPFTSAGYPARWRAGFKRVPNGQGHRDIVGPTATLEATGYKTLTFPMPVLVPKVIVEMTPSPAELKPGINRIVVRAQDSVTGEPAELRVMAGEHLVVGNTNLPLELEWKKGEKRPEIWVTSLFHLYSDVVVAPAQ